MADKKKRPNGDHKSDIKNPNKGTSGTNITWDKAQGNRGKQLNPNRKDSKNQGYTSNTVTVSINPRKNIKAPTDINPGDISIIIAVKNNQSGINLFLEQFFITQHTSNYPKEIIIVDNGSDTPIYLPKKYLKSPLLFHILHCSNSGPASARNFGARYATGEWLLFTDSDCVPTRTFITGYLKSMSGSIAYAGDVKSFKGDIISSYYDNQRIFLPPQTNETFSPQYLITANTLIWKRAFDEISGFNESFQIVGGEDVDLGLRLLEIGNLSYSLESVVLHDVDSSILELIKRFYRYGKGNRLVSHYHGINLSPKTFTPNRKGIINYLLAKVQYLSMLLGFRSLRLDQA